MKLGDLQKDFQELIFSRVASSLLLDDVHPAHRLEAYVDGYPARITEALEETFEKFKGAISTTEWEDLVEEYAAEFRSPSKNLSDAAKYFPEFLATHSITTNKPYLHDLALLELSIMASFHARMEPSLAIQDLADFFRSDPASVELNLQEHVRIADMRQGVFDLWKGIPWSRLDSGERETVLVYRRGWEVMLEPASAAACQFLLALREIPSFQGACERMSSSLTEDVSKYLHEWLYDWVAKGLFKKNKEKLI